MNALCQNRIKTYQNLDRNMRLLIIGCNGQVGKALIHRLQKETNHKVYGLTGNQFRIEASDKLHVLLDTYKPNLVINCSAFHKLISCEEDPAKSFLVNGKAVFELCKVCQDREIRVFHFSTNYVFDGNKRGPYLENDPVGPLQIYGLSKLYGEKLIETLDSHLITVVRTAGIYSSIGSSHKNSNFVKTVLTALENQTPIYLPDDEITSLTNAYDLSAAIIGMIENCISHKSLPKVIHLTNHGIGSWFQFGEFVANLVRKQDIVKPRTSGGIDKNGFIRPLNSSLGSIYQSDFDFIKMPSWEDSLSDFLTLQEQEN